jgi:hypothetical protein
LRRRVPPYTTDSAAQEPRDECGRKLVSAARYLQAHDLTLQAIRGVMPISGVYTFQPDRMTRIIGAGQEAADSASPLKHVSGQEPPFLILYAQHDFPGCGRMSEDLCEALRRHDVTATCTEIKDRNHISIMFRLMLSDADPTTQALLKFVAGHSGMKLTLRATPAGGSDLGKQTGSHALNAPGGGSVRD